MPAQGKGTDAITEHEILKERYRSLEFRRLAIEALKARLGPRFPAEDEAELLRVRESLHRIEVEMEDLGVSGEQVALINAEDMLLTRPPPARALVGRDREIEEYSALLGEWGSIAITGQPGIGKSALGTALARQVAPEKRIFWFRFIPELNLDAESVLWGLAAFLARLGHDEPWRVLNSERGQLDRPASLPLDVWVGLVAAELGRCQAVVCFDDCQHLSSDDSGSHESSVLLLLRGLVGRAGDYRVILMGRRLSPDLDVPQRTLEGLSIEASSELVSGLVPEEMAGWVSESGDLLRRRLGGNPQLLVMFSTTLAREVTDRDSFHAALEALHDYPSVAEYIVTEFWSCLPEDERLALQATSLFRHGAPETALFRILEESGVTDVQPLFNDLVRKGIVTHVKPERIGSEGRYSAHEIYSKFCYEELDLDRRREWHAMIGLDLVSSDPLEAVYHFFAADEHDLGLTTLQEHKRTLLQSGQVEAAMAMVSALTKPMFSKQPCRWVDACELRGEWQQITGRYEEARDSFSESLRWAEELALGTLREAVLSCQLGVTRFYQGRYGDARSCLHDASRLLAGLADSSKQEEGVIDYWLARVYSEEGSQTKASECARRSVEAFEEARDRRWQTLAYNVLVMASFRSGDGQGGHDALRRALGLVETYALNDTPEAAAIYNSAGIVYDMQGDHQRGIEYWRRSLDVGVELGIPHRVILSEYNLGYAMTQLGRWEEAADYLGRALADSRRVGDEAHALMALMGRANVDHRLGRWEEAISLCEEGLASVSEGEQAADRAWLLSYLGQFHRDMGERDEFERGLGYLDDAWQMIGYGSEDEMEFVDLSVEVLAARAEIKARLGQLSGHGSALDDTRLALQLAEEQQDGYQAGIARVALGVVYTVLGERERAESHFAKAEELLVDDGYEIGRVWLRRGEMYARFGDVEQASADLDRAVAQYEKIGSLRFHEMARQAREALGRAG